MGGTKILFERNKPHLGGGVIGCVSIRSYILSRYGVALHWSKLVKLTKRQTY